MAKMLSPAALLRMAVLDRRLLPGSASMMFCAFFLGSSDGTFLECRAATAESREGLACERRSDEGSACQGGGGEGGNGSVSWGQLAWARAGDATH